MKVITNGVFITEWGVTCEYQEGHYSHLLIVIIISLSMYSTVSPLKTNCYYSDTIGLIMDQGTVRQWDRAIHQQ